MRYENNFGAVVRLLFDFPAYCFTVVMIIFLAIVNMNTNLNIGTLNVNGARDSKKRMAVFEFIKLKSIDVMFLQETHSDQKNEVDWRREGDGLTILSHKSSISGGVAILFSKACIPLSYEVDEIVKGRCVKVVAKFENLNIVFLNIYAPTGGPDRVLFLGIIGNTLKSLKTDDLLFLGGDFNCTQNDKLDRNHLEPHTASQRAVVQMIETYDLCDLWRSMHQSARQYTWAHSRGNSLSLARLDRMYVFNHQASSSKSCRICPVSFSDHCAVICCISVASFKSKSAYWHFNTCLLEDRHFVDVFTYFWENFKEQKSAYVSLEQWWDCGKIQIKQLCQQYTVNVSGEIARSMKILESEIVELQELTASTGNVDNGKVLKRKKNMLAGLMDFKAQGALVRSRFQGVVQMDAPSKFFFNLERKNGQSRLIHALRSVTGQELTEPAQIRSCATRFYSELYKSELMRCDAFVNDNTFFNGLSKVDKDSCLEMDKVLTHLELEQALFSMKKGVSPGIDGLPVSFYKVFWSIMGKDLLEVLRESLEKGLLPLSCRRAIITLLPKKGNLQDISNWRPVSLLCTEYKILSKALAMRLKKVMAQVVHSDQSYCIPNRSIFDNITLVRDLLAVFGNLGTNAGLISLDQQKAFDRVEHPYLWYTLESLGFSVGFISMIRTMYCNIESIVKVNGGLSAPFKVQRGVRQGCPMSGMLYSIAIEPFLHKLRANLKGLSVPCCNDRFFLSAYADDVIVFINDDDDINVLKNVVQEFNLLSSARVNWGKSEALIIGEWIGQRPGLPGGLSWKKGGLKYLGVFLGDDTVTNKNWEGVLDKVRGRLDKWRWLLPQLSYRGRAIIINNLVASALWHKFACVEPPVGLIESIQKEMVNFFWDKLHWVPQAVLFLSKEDGGQGLIHLASRRDTYRLQFIQKLFTGPSDLAWRPLAYSILRGVGGMGLDIALFQMEYKQLGYSGLPAFYTSLFKVWGLFTHRWCDALSSLHWLFEEPIVFGARLDVSGVDMPGLTGLLCTKKAVQLRHIVYKAGGDLQNAKAVASFLGIKSTRYVERFLCKLAGVLNLQERGLLEDYANGSAFCNNNDVIPNIEITPALLETGHVNPLLEVGELEQCDFFSVTGKVLYKNLVKVINKNSLKGRMDTVWRVKLGIGLQTKPVWRTIYKTPLNKRTGDLQWRILHGAIAVNALTSAMNPTVCDRCPFCLERETIYHCFMECFRLGPLFSMLSVMFLSLGTVFTKQGFIFGFTYNRMQRSKCQLINFIIGQAKLAVYLSRKNMVQRKPGEIIPVFKNLIKSRILIDFHFYKLMSAIEVFEDLWCYHGALCSVLNDDLFFAPLLE